MSPLSLQVELILKDLERWHDDVISSERSTFTEALSAKTGTCSRQIECISEPSTSRKGVLLVDYAPHKTLWTLSTTIQTTFGMKNRM